MFSYSLFPPVDKSQREEDKLSYEHRKEIDELNNDLSEKDAKMEDLIDNYEVQLQVRFSFNIPHT